MITKLKHMEIQLEIKTIPIKKNPRLKQNYHSKPLTPRFVLKEKQISIFIYNYIFCSLCCTTSNQGYFPLLCFRLIQNLFLDKMCVMHLKPQLFVSKCQRLYNTTFQVIYFPFQKFHLYHLLNSMYLYPFLDLLFKCKITHYIFIVFCCLSSSVQLHFTICFSDIL